jgi:hypothetical protein
MITGKLVNSRSSPTRRCPARVDVPLRYPLAMPGWRWEEPLLPIPDLPQNAIHYRRIHQLTTVEHRGAA